MPLLIRAEDVNGLLTMEEAIDAVEAGFREWGKSPELNAPRKRIMTPEGVRVSVHPGGIPSLGGIGVLAHSEHVAVSKEVQTYHNMGGPVTVLFDVKDASLMAILVGRVALKELPAERPTPIRTAATSAVGTRCLARENSQILGILGAGGEAKYHLLALAKTRPFKLANVYCRTQSTREQFCRSMEKLVSCEVAPVSSAKEVVESADVLLTATNSNVPVFSGEWLQSGAHVTSIMGGNVGLVRAGIAATPRRELDDTTIRRSDVIVVNSREQAIQDEQADLFGPVQAGFLSWEDVGELGQLLNNVIPGRTSANQITLFKTTTVKEYLMNIDLHSHFFPVEALQNPGKYENRAPKMVLDKGKLSVTSQIGSRPGLGPGAYDPSARIKALDQMTIDMQAISPSPILLFYWEEPAVAAHFSRTQNQAIQDVVNKHPDRFVGFGSVPLQSITDSLEIAREAKSMGLKGLEIGNAVGDKLLDDPSFEAFFDAAQELDMLLFVHPLEGGLDADDPLSPILGNVLQFTFRTTMMVERMILKGMFEKYPNLRLCLSHGSGLLAFNIWRLDHSYSLRPELKKIIPEKPSGYLKKLYFDTIVHSTVALEYLVKVVGADRVVIGTDYPMAMGDFEAVQKVMQLELPAVERELILGGNAAQALNV